MFIDRAWVQKNNNIPHFSNVIKNVDKNEGVEITMNCNSDAFKWIIDFVKIKTDGDETKVGTAFGVDARRGCDSEHARPFEIAFGRSRNRS